MVVEEGREGERTEERKKERKGRAYAVSTPKMEEQRVRGRGREVGFQEWLQAGTGFVPIEDCWHRVSVVGVPVGRVRELIQGFTHFGGEAWFVLVLVGLGITYSS